MLISFIVTYYNEPAWMLRECIESIFAVNLRNEEREVIVIDDGCENFPHEVTAPFKERLRLIHSPHVGIADIRNIGIEQAQGEYLQFVDADDHLIPSEYDNIISLLKSNPSIEIVHFSFTRSLPQYNRNEKLSISGIFNGIDYLLKYNFKAAPWAYVYKKKLTHNLRFLSGIIHEDTLFTPQLFLRAESICHVNSKVVFYRKHPESIMGKRDKLHIEKRQNDDLTVLRQLRQISSQLSVRERKAIDCVLHQQTMNDLISTFLYHHNLREMWLRAQQLKKEGFLPLPLKPHNWKYLLFALFSRTIF